MDETAWRVLLAKHNINITNIDYQTNKVYFDFSYRTRPGRPLKWIKTFAELRSGESWDGLATRLAELVLELRKELEVSDGRTE